ELNVFTSREGKSAAGENALHGEGFYTMPGRSGARGTGFTVRMELRPEAREGTDFVREGGYFILKNKAAASFIPERIELSLVQFFREIEKTGEGFKADDRALIHAFRRRTGRTALVSPEEMETINGIVKFGINKRPPNLALIKEWLSLSEMVKFPDIMERIIKA